MASNFSKQQNFVICVNLTQIHRAIITVIDVRLWPDNILGIG